MATQVDQGSRMHGYHFAVHQMIGLMATTVLAFWLGSSLVHCSHVTTALS